MSFRTDSLHDRLTKPQRHDLMLLIREFGEGTIIKDEDGTSKDRFLAGLDLCKSWGVKTSRTAVHDFYKRYGFGWRVELGAWAAKHMENMPSYEKEMRLVTAQKLFAEITDVDCPPKMLILARALQIEEEKTEQRERLATNRGKLEQAKLKLRREEFEFDAAKAALKHLDALRAIKAKKGLDSNERLKQARLQLFGTLPQE